MFRKSTGACVEVDLEPLEFHKSLRSTDNGTCVEVAFTKLSHTFHKSTRSSPAGACVEVCDCDCGVHVRDSKDPQGPVLEFSRQSWIDFIADIKENKYNL